MKLPKNTKDWHHDLVIAATQRFNLAVQGNKKTQNIWRVALHQLERSQNPVYVMKSGENRGRLRGLPKKLDGRIYDVFRDIVNGIEPVVNIQVPMQRVNFREESLYKRTKYRDGRYSFLASIYSLTVDEHSYIYGNVIKAGMRNFTDLEVEGDRWGKRGAWKAKDTVVERGLVSEDKTYGPHRFLLTPLGFDFCRALFTEKYHPSISANYVLVKPRAGFVPNNGQQVEDINDRVPHNLGRFVNMLVLNRVLDFKLRIYLNTRKMYILYSYFPTSQSIFLSGCLQKFRTGFEIERCQRIFWTTKATKTLTRATAGMTSNTA